MIASEDVQITFDYPRCELLISTPLGMLSLAETDQIVVFVTTSSLGSLVNWDQ